MNKIYVDKRDVARILLTETLPYETPIIFSNEKLYWYQKKTEEDILKSPPLVTQILEQSNAHTIPYNYDIKKAADAFRALSVMHPGSQLRFVDFYKTYHAFLTYHCSKSDFTLRAPVQAASYYYEKTLAPVEESVADGEGVEHEADAFDPQPKLSSSFFVYRKYSHLFRFYDSYEFHRLEKRFKFLCRFDIAKCFHSIYTHTIAWAIKDKEIAKNHTNARSFESDFDILIRAANYNETNGIVVGPEISRIFAEIILQKIDLIVRNRLDEQGLKYKVDYNVRRYIDDYFVFSNSPEIYGKIKSIFQEELRKFNLYINDSKTLEFEVPFSTPQTIAKTQAMKAIKEAFGRSVNDEKLWEAVRGRAVPTDELFKNIRPYSASRKLIIDLKCIVKAAEAGYQGVTGYCLAILRKQLKRVAAVISSPLSDKEREKLSNYLLFVLEIAFFLYAMDLRVRTTYLISQILIFITDLVKKVGGDVDHIVHKKIMDESIDAISNFKNANGGSGIEIMNLLIVLNHIAKEHEFSEHHLAAYFGAEVTSDARGTKAIKLSKLTYFQFAAALYYVKNNAKYNSLKLSICEEIETRIAKTEAPHKDAELTMLFFDVLACPYLDMNYKRKITNLMNFKVTGRNLRNINEAMTIIAFCKNHLHFTNWFSTISLTGALLKKELKSPYE